MAGECSCKGLGKVFNTIKRVWEQCPECLGKRRQEVRKGVTEDGKSIQEVVGFNNTYLNSSYIWDGVIPEGEKVFIEESSLERLKEVTEDINSRYILGKLAKDSYVFGLGVKGSIERLVYPLLMSAYQGGIEIGKFRSISNIHNMMLQDSPEMDNVYKPEVVWVLIEEGCTKGHIATAKGLMQTRSLRGLKTLFVTTWSIEACSNLLKYPDSDNTAIATGVFVKYKYNGEEGKESNYINQLRGVKNSSAIGFSVPNLTIEQLQGL